MEESYKGKRESYKKMCERKKREENERWDQNQIRRLEFRNSDFIFIISDLKKPM